MFTYLDCYVCQMKSFSIFRHKMTTQVVTVGQPQEGQKGAELQMMAPHPGMGTNIVLPMGLPPGLAYLQSLNEVLIHQHFDVLEGNTLTQIQVHVV